MRSTRWQAACLSFAFLVGLVWLVAPQPVTAAWIGEHAERLYRDDPRPAGDLPAGIGGSQDPLVVPTSPRRRLSRRAQRRLQRRGIQILPEGSSTLVDLQAPVPPHSGLPIDHRGLPYGTGDTYSRLNLHLPGGCREGNLPLVVWIPGTDWSDGSRDECPLVWLTSRGFAVASIGYRPSQAATFPAQRDDCQMAIARVVQDAAVWGIDPSRVAIVGRAAGGHLAALIGLDSHTAEAPADDFTPAAFKVASICGISMISHLPTLGPDHDRANSAASRLIGGPLPELREAALAASPLRYASAGDPPTLLIHARNRSVIPVSQSERLHATLQAADVESTLVLTDDEPELTPASQTGQLLLTFLRRTLTSEVNSVMNRGDSYKETGKSGSNRS
jgi:acetyl esterase/lipase